MSLRTFTAAASGKKESCGCSTGKSDKDCDCKNETKSKGIKGLPDLKEFAKEFNKNYVFELDEKDFVPMINPSTGEWNPPRGVFNGAEPTRYGDWEIKGRCYDF